MFCSLFMLSKTHWNRQQVADQSAIIDLTVKHKMGRFAIPGNYWHIFLGDRLSVFLVVWLGSRKKTQCVFVKKTRTLDGCERIVLSPLKWRITILSVACIFIEHCVVKIFFHQISPFEWNFIFGFRLSSALFLVETANNHQNKCCYVLAFQISIPQKQWKRIMQNVWCDVSIFTVKFIIKRRKSRRRRKKRHENQSIHSKNCSFEIRFLCVTFHSILFLKWLIKWKTRTFCFYRSGSLLDHNFLFFGWMTKKWRTAYEIMLGRRSAHTFQLISMDLFVEQKICFSV